MARYHNIVILTGAGLSAESVLGTFRGQGGLWENFRIEDVATPEGFARDPVRVHGFYNLRRSWHKQARPNAAHLALARLEHEHGNVLTVTQNIDALHEAAGTKTLIHMHGELERALCAACVLEARTAGAHAVELNLEPSDGADLFLERIEGPATEIVPAYVDKLLSI